MDGTCVEMPDQRKPGETEGDPLVMSFNSEVLRIQQVRQGGQVWAGACPCCVGRLATPQGVSPLSAAISPRLAASPLAVAGS